MPSVKYRREFADELVAYFMKFIELRDDPEIDDGAERHGMVTVEIGKNGKVTKKQKPSSGYPTLTKFAIKIGVTPRTLTNWKNKYPAFAEACEFADAIQDDILNERALVGDVDGRVAMKIRELKINARRMADGEGGREGLKIEMCNHIDQNETIELKEWEGEVVEDTEYANED